MSNLSLSTMRPTVAFLVLFTCFGIAACTAQPPLDASTAYPVAVERAAASDPDGAMEALLVALEAHAETYQRALLDPAFADGLRDTRAFRVALHEAAIRHEINQVRLTDRDEPGEWIVVEGQVLAPDGTPLPRAVARVFATDSAGLYHPTLEGEDRPRLFGSVVSGPDGRFVIETVRPGPYPGTRDARHLHLSVFSIDGEFRLDAPYYMVFDDDPLLFEPQNGEQRGEALRIQMDTSGDVSRGTLLLPMR